MKVQRLRSAALRQRVLQVSEDYSKRSDYNGLFVLWFIASHSTGAVCNNVNAGLGKAGLAISTLHAGMSHYPHSLKLNIAMIEALLEMQK